MNECSELKLVDRVRTGAGGDRMPAKCPIRVTGRRDYVGMTTGTSESCRLAATPKLAQSGHNQTFTAGNYALARLHARDWSLISFENSSRPNGFQSFGTQGFLSVPGYGTPIVHRGFILSHSRLATCLSDFSTHHRRDRNRIAQL